MRFARNSSFYDAPVPSEDLRRADGSIAIGGFPNPENSTLAAQAIALVSSDARGFSTCGGVFFSLSGAIDPARLPDMPSSITKEASVFLVSVDPQSPDYLQRYPVQASFTADGGPFGTKNQLSIVPLQGTPLRPGTTYAAVILRALGDATGAPLGQSPEMQELVTGATPAGLALPAFTAYESALTSLSKIDVARSAIAGLAVYTTDTPIAEMEAVRTDILARPTPTLDAPFARTDVFPTYCVYQTTLGMPDYQSGVPPFDTAGGTWLFDAAGKPIFQRVETARIVVTIPRTTMPTAGFPTAVFIRTGGGGDRPLVDRGQAATNGGPAIVPGSGPALYFTAAGFAGVEVDGPLGGIRNTTNGNEDYLIFNIFNGGALRDNIRESAVELVLLAHVLEGLSFDPIDCPGLAAGGATSPHVTFDMKNAALMGHSMGATIEPLVLAYEPLYRAAVLSGAGASWIENILYKELPLDVLPAIDLLLGYPNLHRTLDVGDPALSLIQWAIEPADPLVYTSRIIREPASGELPRHVLMEQGIVDHYILPPIANATSLSLGLDLAGTELDGTAAELASMPTLLSVIGFAGRNPVGLPASLNLVTPPVSGVEHAVTGVVIQHPSDGIEDGHEIVFQTDPPKHEYRCFLQSFLAGKPVVPTNGTAFAPCD